MPWLIIAGLIGLVVTACSSTTSRYVWLGDQQPARSRDCEVEIIFTPPPARDFARVARLDVHIERTSWIQPGFEAELPELKRLACQAGADAVVDIQPIIGSHLEVRRLHVSGTAIKWR